MEPDPELKPESASANQHAVATLFPISGIDLRRILGGHPSDRILFMVIGIPASGKSTFAKCHLSHAALISRDLAGTRKKEMRRLQEALQKGAAIVVDDTNVTRDERSRIFEAAKREGYSVLGFFFECNVSESLKRNKKREKPIPEVGVVSRFKDLECPAKAEGFSELFYVKTSDHSFFIEEYKEEEAEKKND